MFGASKGSGSNLDVLFAKISKSAITDKREIFRFELNRLHSFVTWPSGAGANPTQLARVGFYYLDQEDTCACFHCNVQIGQWEKTDLPLTEHEKHAPNCNFIKGEEVGNVPLMSIGQIFSIQSIRATENEIRNQRQLAAELSTPLADGTDSGLLDVLQSQMADLSIKYPFSVLSNLPTNLGETVSDSASVWSQSPDTGATYGAQVQIDNVQQTRNSMNTTDEASHTSKDSTPAVAAGQTRQEMINQAIISISTEPVRQGVVEYCPLDTLKSIMQSANHPEYAHINRRMESFAYWPYSHVQNPIRLAEAGFFYIGREDRIRCFLCNGGLCNWEFDDIPWFEHCRWFERCRYALACKENPVIKAIVDTAQQLRLPESSPHTYSGGDVQCDDS